MNLHSPWASVVRGHSDDTHYPAAASAPESLLTPPPEHMSVIAISGSRALPESSDVNEDANAAAVETGSVMGGDVSWPALSESTRPVMRSPPFSQAPLISHPPQRQVNANTTPNNATRQLLRNRGGGGSGFRGHSSGIWPSHNMYNQTYSPLPPQFPIYEVSHHIGARPIGGVVVSPLHMDNGYSSQRINNTNTPRRGNYGTRPRGNGQGGRRGQGRRDGYHFPPQYMPPNLGYMPPPPPLPPGGSTFIAPQPTQYRPFVEQMGFDMQSSYIYIPPIHDDFYTNMSTTAPPPPPPPVPAISSAFADENSLTNKIINQVNYYFSDDNLVKDDFLKSKMDNQGWVPISLIASFPRMKTLTDNAQLIIDALKYSTVVEVQDGMVRRCNEWTNWVEKSSC